MNTRNKPYLKPMLNDSPKKSWNWQPEGLLEYSPLFIWPFNLRKFIFWIKETYLMFSIRMIVLLLSVLTWLFFMPAIERCSEFKIEWIFEVYSRNIIMMFFIAGGLHLYFYTYKKQGLKLKFDLRDLAKKSRVFAFKNQVLDNMYYSIIWGVTFWTGFETIFLWSYANDYLFLMNNPKKF